MKRDSQLKKRILSGATALIMMLGTAYLPAAPAVFASGTSDSVTVSSETNDAIAVTLQPANVTTEPDRITTFIVSAAGSQLKYQWYFKKDNSDTWVLWKGHTTVKTSATANVTWDGMLVRCEITDSSGNTVTSDAAKVKVNAPLQIVRNPSYTIAQAGEKTAFSVKAVGDGLKYQWYFKKDNSDTWVLWKGHTTARTSATANVTWDGMLVRCEVTDSEGNTVISEPAKIKVNAPLQIVRQPSDTVAVLGEQTEFSVKAVGSGLKYQWYFKKKDLAFWSLWKGHITAVTSAVANKTWESMQLQCIITDSTGASVTTDSITVSVDTPLTIVTQPEDITLDLGSSVTFKAEASGIDVKYRWYYKKVGQADWNKWDERTTPETTAKVNSTWEGMLIKCVITGNVDRTVETVPAKITVNAPLSITTQPTNVCVKIQSKAEFKVAASGIGLKYQWYIKKEGDTAWNKFGNNSSSTVSGISEASWHNMLVKCVISDNVGKKVTSNTITATIDTTGYPSYLVSLLGRNKEAASFVLNYPIRKDSYKGVTFNLTEYKNSKTVPLFMQWDERWGYDKYGTGCIGTSGCGPTALSMVSMYVLKDTTLTPRKMAQFAIKEGYCIPGNGSSWSLMDKGGTKLGMKVTKVSNSEDAIKKQLKKGNPIVAIMGKGYFTTGGHYIVLTDYVDGKIKVNDSNSYINSEKLWKYSDIKGQIRNLWAFSKPATTSNKATPKAASVPAFGVCVCQKKFHNPQKPARVLRHCNLPFNLCGFIL